jgi:hypothetical protein
MKKQPFSIQYKNKMKKKREKINNILNRKEKLIRNYWKKYVRNSSKKDDANTPEKDCPKN